MALPIVIDSTDDPKLASHNYYLGPCKASNGAFYVILLTNDEKGATCYKATDPTDSWSVQDGSNGPAGSDTVPSAAMRLNPDGDIIGGVSQQSDGSVHWSEFIVESAGGNDVWRIFTSTNKSVSNIGGGALDAGVFACDAVWRSDDRRVVVYQGDREDIAGTKYDRIKLAHSTDGDNWTKNIAVDPGGAVHYRACRVALDGSDNVTILFRGSDNKLYQRVFKSDNALQSAAQDTGGTVSSAATFAISPCVWIDRTGTDRWKALYADADNDLRQIVYDSGTNPTSFDTSVEVSADTPGPGGIAVDGGTVYGLATKAADKDVYKTDDGGGDTSWSTLTKVLTATVNEISTNIYTRGSDTVHAYVYDDGGTVKYNELVL